MSAHDGNNIIGVSVALSAQAALLGASTCVGAYTREAPPRALGYAALFAPVLALFLMWRRLWLWPAHATLTAALCVLCVWGAAAARPIVRVVWHHGGDHPNHPHLAHPYDNDDAYDATEQQQQQHALYAASAVLVLSTTLAALGGVSPLLAPLLSALAIVALDADAWDWGAATAFIVASVLAMHLAVRARTSRSDETEAVDEALARAWGTPAAFALVGALLTRPGRSSGSIVEEAPPPPTRLFRLSAPLHPNHQRPPPAPRTASVWAMDRGWSPRLT
jgi:hypothetical protein